MPKFFTCDRAGRLAPGLILNLTKHKEIKLTTNDDGALQQHVDAMYPGGVTEHGYNFFLRPDSRANVTNPAIELLFEYVRRAAFPQRPSRFQSTFAALTTAEANQFRSAHCEGQGTIWEVEARDFFRADMNLLTQKYSALVTSYLAHRYWDGASVSWSEPFWEYLLVPPVKVLNRVQ